MIRAFFACRTGIEQAARPVPKLVSGPARVKPRWWSSSPLACLAWG
jgi:hypothetical protein